MLKLERAELSACDEADAFLQTGFWGAFKARFGWEALTYNVCWPGNNAVFKSPLLVLRRSLAAGFSLAYIPWGPELPLSLIADEHGEKTENIYNTALEELALALKNELPKNTVFIRFDPPWYNGGIPVSPMANAFVKAGADIQAPDTVIVDLSQSMESVIAGMKPKCRYNAKLALKKGVMLRRAGVEEIINFYELLKKTARRDGIAIHGIEYYETLLKNGFYNGKKPYIRLYLAEHEGDLLAGIMTLFWNRKAVYLYGASSDEKRSFMAPYALQLKAMEDAKESGCTEYDLYGIPPNEDPAHPMAGLYRFKTGFGGKIIHRPGSWDYPNRLLIYKIFRSMEALRKNLRTFKKRLKRQI